MAMQPRSLDCGGTGAPPSHVQWTDELPPASSLLSASPQDASNLIPACRVAMPRNGCSARCIWLLGTQGACWP